VRRREFITLVGGAAVVWPVAARAVQPVTMKRIAIVHPTMDVSELIITSEYQGYRAFFNGLSRLGYIEGQNLVVERHSGEGRTDHYPELARDVVRTSPDVILVTSNVLAVIFKAATATIPLITLTSNPVALGLVPSLARPGGNITGISTDGGSDIWGKRLGLLLEAIPKPSNVKWLGTRGSWELPEYSQLHDAAKQVGISVTGALLDGTIDDAQYRRVFAAMEQDRVDALLVSPEAAVFPHRQRIVELAAKSRIPAIYTSRYFVEPGGLMTYSADLADLYRQAADQVDKIFRGANPGDIPIYQATRYEFIINLRTAKALGLELPATLIGRADEVIE
jgi:putative tryptophan/tyrosine transport system substrate-binding protein